MASSSSNQHILPMPFRLKQNYMKGCEFECDSIGDFGEATTLDAGMQHGWTLVLQINSILTRFATKQASKRLAINALLVSDIH